MTRTPSARHDLAFLHTAPVHVGTFTALTAELAPGLRVHHVVAERLLVQARMGGATPELTRAVHDAMRGASEGGASVVVCTCSTLGELAESARGAFHAMRIDRAMADQAVTQGARVLVVAALASTLAPTRNLLADAARRANVRPVFAELHVEHAWALFEDGDDAGYLRAIASAIREAAAGANVAVLAQASMAPVADYLTGLGIPVLSSPRLGVQAAIAALTRGRAAV